MTPALIHNTYPDFAERIRSLVHRSARAQRDDRNQELQLQRAANARLHKMIADQNKEIVDLASVNEALRAEIQIPKRRRTTNGEGAGVGMGLPILIVESELALWCMSEQFELPEPPDSPVSGTLKAGSREAQIAQWRSVLSLPGSIERCCRSVKLSRPRSGGDGRELLRDGERLAQLLLRRSWKSLPRRERKALRQREV